MYTDPSFSHLDRNLKTGTTTKRISEMSTEEIRSRAVEDGLKYYQQQYEANPNEQTKYELDSYLLSIGKRPDAEIDRLYDIPFDQLRTEFERKGKAVDDANLEKFREGQAKVWMASRPEYEATPQNAERLVAEVDRMGLHCSVYEIDQAFWSLVRQGMIVPKEIVEPVVLPTRDEAYDMPLDELKRLAEQSSR
jgi:hypothetical protein